MNESDLQVVGIGEILWDMLPTGKLLGGAPANFAYHVNDLGISATVVSSVGNDASGDEIVERVWKHLGMDSSFIEVTPNYPTGTAYG